MLPLTDTHMHFYDERDGEKVEASRFHQMPRGASLAAAQSGAAPDRVPEPYGVIHLTCAQDGDIYGVTQKDVFRVDVSTGPHPLLRRASRRRALGGFPNPRR